MSKYYVNKFLFTVDRDPEYLRAQPKIMLSDFSDL